MSAQLPNIELIVLGEFDVVSDVLQQWRAESDRSINATLLKEAKQFYTTELAVNQLIITDTNALGMGLNQVLNRAKSRAAAPPVVLIADAGESEQIADGLERGVDEYVLRSDDRGFSSLLLQAIKRAVTRRRDLPLVGDHIAKPHFWGLLEAMPIPTKVLDEEGRLLYVSPSFAEFLNYERNDMEGRSIFDFMHPDEVEDAINAYKKVLSAQEAVPSTGLAYGQNVLPDRRYLTKEANDEDQEERVRWGNLYLLPLWHNDGSVHHVVGLMVDITERKTTAIELDAREKHERAILNTTVDGIMTIDTDGQIETFNRTCEKIFGYDADEIQDQNVSILLAPKGDQSVLESIKSIETSSEPQRVQGRTKDGEEIPLELGIGKMTIRGETKYTVIVRDISERIDFMERAHRADRMEAIGHFAGGIAHDFNNILTIIKTNAYLLSEQNLVIRGLGEKHLKKIFDAADRASRLTENFLSLTPEPGGSAEPININDVIGGLESLFDSMVEEDIEQKLRLDDNLAPVHADLGEIEQIVMNLILNARDAMPHGGRLTIVTCNISTESEGGTTPRELDAGQYVLLEVHDTGEGIPDEIRDRIFDPYVTTRTEGTGLGLATVYSLVESLGGTIDVETEPSIGSTFRVYLPATEDKPEQISPGRRRPEQRQTEPKPKQKKSSDTKTILLAEDEDDIRASLVILLEQEGCEVIAAADGDEALELAQRHQGTIDLLLTDMVMPGLNGMELAEKFRGIHPDSEVIFVSGYAGDVLERKDLGSEQVHLTKPFDIGELKETLREALS